MKTYNNFNEMFNSQKGKTNDLSVFNTLYIHTKPKEYECYYDEDYDEWKEVDAFVNPELVDVGIVKHMIFGLCDLDTKRFELMEVNYYPDGKVEAVDMPNSSDAIYTNNKLNYFIEGIYDDCITEYYGNYIPLEDLEYVQDSIPDDIKEYEETHKAELEQKLAERVNNIFGLKTVPGTGGFVPPDFDEALDYPEQKMFTYDDFN